MRIEDSFRVDVPVEEAWRLLMDIERIAPCLPGAQLQEVAGDEYRGIVKVKVGPITAQYRGSARFAETDQQARTARVVASGRDTRGQGNASAEIRIGLVPDGGGTRVDLDTDLTITGKIAQFGRGVLADVSSRLLAQFVANLERDVLRAGVVDLTAEEPGSTAAAEPPSEPPSEPSTEPVELAAPSGNGAGVRRVEAPAAEPVDLLELGGAPVLKRLLPLLAGVVLVVLLLRRRARRQHTRRS